MPDVYDIAAENDDGSEKDDTTWDSRTWSEVLFGGASPSNWYNAAWRFAVTANQGDTVTLAELKINIATINPGVATHVYGNDADDCPAFSATRPSGWTKTGTNTQFGPTTTGVKTINVTAIVQEILDRAGWSSGNFMGLSAFEDTGTASGWDLMQISDYPNANDGVLEVTIAAGAQTIGVDAASAVFSTPDVTIALAALNVSIDAASAAYGVTDITVALGALAVSVDAAIAAYGVPNVTVVLGGLTIAVDTAIGTFVITSLTVTGGTVSAITGHWDTFDRFDEFTTFF